MGAIPKFITLRCAFEKCLQDMKDAGSEGYSPDMLFRKFISKLPEILHLRVLEHH